MMYLDRLPGVVKGTLLMVVGFILLFYTLGIIEKGITTVLIVLSAGMICYGFLKTGYASLITGKKNADTIKKELDKKLDL